MIGTAGLQIYIDDTGFMKDGIDSVFFEDYIENKLIGAFRSLAPYKNYLYNETRVGLDNFFNLQNLTKDC